MSAIGEVYQARAATGWFQAAGISRMQASHWGMTLAHIGFAVLVIGVAMTKTLSVEKDVRMKIGDTVRAKRLPTFTLSDVYALKGPNYGGQAAELEVYSAG